MAAPSDPNVGDHALHQQVLNWLHREAELLDSGQEAVWLEEMVHKDVVYRLPLRQTVERARGTGFHPTMCHLDETYGTLKTRVARNRTQYAWAEDPPARIRHFVSNVRVQRNEARQLEVKSNLLIYRLRMEQTVPQLISGERHDVLVAENSSHWKLRSRTIYLDLTVIETHNLAIFF